MAAKKRRSYRAYAPGSVQARITSDLRRAVSALRTSAGCNTARKHLDDAYANLYGGGLAPTGATLRTQKKRVDRVMRVFSRKCYFARR